jgi:hypothetical protein
MSLNLRKSIVDEFWKRKDPRMGSILMWMERVEDWKLDDHESFSKALLQLVPAMESASKGAMMAHLDQIIKVLAYTSSGRALRIIQWFDEHYPKGLSIELLQTAKNSPNDVHSALLIDRLRALQSLSLLPQVFNPSRTAAIAQLLRNRDRERF